MICLDFGQAGGLWKRKFFRPSHSWVRATRIDQYGVGAGRGRTRHWSLLGGDEEGIQRPLRLEGSPSPSPLQKKK